MARYSRTRTATGGSNKLPGGRINTYFGLYIGVVKDNVDAQRMGRLRVWVPEFGSRPDDESGWITVSYMSPFAGATNPNYVKREVEEFASAQQSYGWWGVPPDLENEVGIMFAGGDISRGFWFGCAYAEYMNNMVPGVPSGQNYEYPDETLPTTEYNKHETRNVDPDSATRPYHQYYAESITKQGLSRDTVRGQSTSSARRESPSQVYGLLTPGPVEETNTGHRKGGSQMVFDDLDGNEHIGFKTRGGSQVRIDESNGLIYIVNRDGTGWVEITESGQIQVYGKGSISIRSEEDVNIRADKDVNIEAGKDIHMKAAQSYQAPADEKSAEILEDDAGEGGNIIMQCMSDMDVTVQTNFRMNVLDENYDLMVKGNMTVTNGGDYNKNVGKRHVDEAGSSRGIKSGNYHLEHGGNIKNTGIIVSDGVHFAPDFKSPSHGLNDHQHMYKAPRHSLPPIPTTKVGGGGGNSSASGPTAEKAVESKTPPLFEKTNVYYDSDVLAFDKETQSVKTIVSKFMTAEPCRDHENKGGQEF